MKWQGVRLARDRTVIWCERVRRVPELGNNDFGVDVEDIDEIITDENKVMVNEGKASNRDD